jgi:5-methyltetrahydrofolate--homocysteine methyltransferase
MVDYVKTIRSLAPEHPILIHANAGLPVIVDSDTVYPETPDHMASQVPDIVRSGACIVGGCCGTTPEHIRKISQEIKNMEERS